MSWKVTINDAISVNDVDAKCLGKRGGKLAGVKAESVVNGLHTQFGNVSKDGAIR